MDHSKYNLMAANCQLKVTKNTFMHTIYMLFPFVPPLSTQLRSPLKLISIILRAAAFRKRNRYSPRSVCVSSVLHIYCGSEMQFVNRKRPHADKIIEFWFVILYVYSSWNDRRCEAHCLFDRKVCGWIYIRHYRNSSAMRSSTGNHFQIIKIKFSAFSQWFIDLPMFVSFHSLFFHCHFT